MRKVPQLKCVSNGFYTVNHTQIFFWVILGGDAYQFPLCCPVSDSHNVFSLAVILGLSIIIYISTQSLLFPEYVW